mmetsp:Transcript_48092/g.114459  ORF Transcript_48092/g.114459 Transcript_48092/m.114459 type:complete len:478 (-) Transcript_48092:705-2138(-)
MGDQGANYSSQLLRLSHPGVNGAARGGRARQLSQRAFQRHAPHGGPMRSGDWRMGHLRPGPRGRDAPGQGSGTGPSAPGVRCHGKTHTPPISIPRRLHRGQPGGPRDKRDEREPAGADGTGAKGHPRLQVRKGGGQGDRAVDGEHGALRGGADGNQRLGEEPAGRHHARGGGGLPVNHLRSRLHPRGLFVHQRVAAEHVRPGAARACGGATGVHRWGRLQVGADQGQVCPRRLPHLCGHQGEVDSELQPPGKQRRQEPLRPDAVPVEGDLEVERGGRHGGLEPHPLRRGRASRPRRRHQVRAHRGRFEARYGRVHIGDLHGRDQHDRHAQHLRGLTASSADHPGPVPPHGALRARLPQEKGGGDVPALPPGALSPLVPPQGAARSVGHPRRQRSLRAAPVPDEHAARVPGPPPRQLDAPRAQAPPPRTLREPPRLARPRRHQRPRQRPLTPRREAVGSVAFDAFNACNARVTAATRL